MKLYFDISASRIVFVRFALNFNEKLMILVDFSNFTAERNGLYVNYYGYYANITSLLHGQSTVSHKSHDPCFHVFLMEVS